MPVSPPSLPGVGASADFPPVLALGVSLRTVEPQRLPPFLGSALHGALGHALHRTVCVFLKRPGCDGCPLHARCAYVGLFQPPVPPADALIAAGVRDEAPRPLLLAPEAGWTRPSGKPIRLAVRDEVPFRVTLVGRAIAETPVVVVTLKALARRGVGIADPPDGSQTRRRGSLDLIRITTMPGEHVVYDAVTDTYTPPPAAPPHDPPAAAAVIEFVTPLRLKHTGRLASSAPPALFFETLARRANALNVIYGSGQPAVDERQVAALAARLVVEDATLRLVHVTRYSATQRARMQWPGLMGTLHWRGEALRELWPLLIFGELVQVGKGTALGFGRYRLLRT